MRLNLPQRNSCTPVSSSNQPAAIMSSSPLVASRSNSLAEIHQQQLRQVQHDLPYEMLLDAFLALHDELSAPQIRKDKTVQSFVEQCRPTRTAAACHSIVTACLIRRASHYASQGVAHEAVFL